VIKNLKFKKCWLKRYRLRKMLRLRLRSRKQWLKDVRGLKRGRFKPAERKKRGCSRL